MFYSFYYLNSTLNTKLMKGELFEHAPAAVPAAVAGNEIFTEKSNIDQGEIKIVFQGFDIVWLYRNCYLLMY